jgi:hypothetical protein
MARAKKELGTEVSTTDAAVNKTIAVKQAYKDVFTSPQGQVVLQDLAKQCHVLSPILMTGDAMQVAMQEGERRIVLMIMKNISFDLGKFQQLIEDSQNEN